MNVFKNILFEIYLLNLIKIRNFFFKINNWLYYVIYIL